MASLLYGAGLRLVECAELRVKDLDFDRHELTIHDGKGRKDRVTMVPARLEAPLRSHLSNVRVQHAKDLAAAPAPSLCPTPWIESTRTLAASGHGNGSSRQSPLRRCRHRPTPPSSHPRDRPSARGQDCRQNLRDRQAHHRPHSAPFLRHPPPGTRLRNPHHSRAPRSQGRQDNPDPHPRPEPRPRGVTSPSTADATACPNKLGCRRAISFTAL